MVDLNETIKLLDDSHFYYIITTNMDGHYTYINKRYAKVFEPIHGTIVGRPYQTTMHPDDANVCVEIAEKCFNNPDKIFPATIRKHNGKGGYVITQWEYKAIWKEDGSPQGIFCLGYDITEHVEDRDQMNMYLDKLKDTEGVLERKESHLKEIAFYQSHIIRQPLSNILGLIDVLDKMEVDQNLRNIISMLLQSSQQLDKVIRGIVGKTYE